MDDWIENNRIAGAGEERGAESRRNEEEEEMRGAHPLYLVECAVLSSTRV